MCRFERFLEGVVVLGQTRLAFGLSGEQSV
jgi:hypothetical protein